MVAVADVVVGIVGAAQVLAFLLGIIDSDLQLLRMFALGDNEVNKRLVDSSMTSASAS